MMSNSNTENNKNDKEYDGKSFSKKLSSILKLLVLIIIIIAIPAYILLFRGDIIQVLRDPGNLTELVGFIEENRTESVLVYLGMQALQIIISVLPGQIFQMAAGYIFGFILGLIYSMLGAAIGSAIAYYLAYFLGRDAISLFIKKETLDTWVTRLNTKQAYIVIFLLYLIPGLPKDIIAYPAGIAKVNFKAFITMSLLGRVPAMAASVLIGTMYEQENYPVMTIIAAVCIIIFIICLINRKSISKYMDKFYEKVSK